MISRSNSVKGAKKSLLPRLFLVEFAAHGANVGVTPIIFIALSLISADVAGVFLGTNVAYVLIMRKGIPDDTGSVAQRITRVFIALLLLGVSSLILVFWFKTAGTTNYLQFTLIGFLKTFIPASTIWAAVSICRKLGLYRKR
jgi:hypothetical protein